MKTTELLSSEQRQSDRHETIFHVLSKKCLYIVLILKPESLNVFL